MNTPDTPDPQAQAQILAHAYQAAVLSTLMKLLHKGKTPTFLDISKTPDTIDLPSNENEDRTNRLN
jgi:hypothetical protein